LEEAGELAAEPTGPEALAAAAMQAWLYRGRPARAKAGPALEEPMAAGVLRSGFAIAVVHPLPTALMA
jgi:hypothetical protein